MKLSKYNIVSKVGDKSLAIYNTVSSGVLYIEDEYVDSFNELLLNGECNKNDLCEELKCGSMLVNNELDELEYLVLRDRINRFSPNSLGLTIAPTMRCNFACKYCYEQGCEYETASSEVENGIVNFVKKYVPTINNLNVTWYGGEPLLNMEAIESLSNSFIELSSDRIKYNAGIITNGYLLNKEIAKRLSELHVRKAQITIDGPKDIHDSRRILHNGEGTYKKIISNIQAVCDILPVTIRVNVDKTNINMLDRLLEEFDSFGFKNKVPLYIAPVDDILKGCKDPSCFTMSEFSDKEISFMEKALDSGFRLVTIPRTGPSICGAILLNSYVIDSKGNLYKCWETIGREDNKVGNVLTADWDNKKLNYWLMYDEFEGSNCKECQVLPTCFGGCPHHYKQTGHHKCRPIKYNIDKTLALFNKMKMCEDCNSCK